MLKKVLRPLKSTLSLRPLRLSIQKKGVPSGHLGYILTYVPTCILVSLYRHLVSWAITILQYKLSALNAHVHAHDNLRKIFRENARAKMHFCHVRLLRKREFKAKTLLTLNDSLADLPQNNFLWAMHRFEIIKIPFLTFPACF